MLFRFPRPPLEATAACIIPPMQELSESSFDDEIKSARKPAICFFWSSFCRPSRQMSVMLSTIEKKYSDSASFFSINLEANPRLSDRAGVLVIPTVIIYRSGRVLARVFGLAPESEIVEAIEDAIVS